MPERRAKGEETRDRILHTALRRFEQQGFAATTMRAIAEEAGCAVGLAYRYYPTKEAMVLELYERLVREFVEGTANLPSTTLSQRWGIAIRGDLARLRVNRGALSGLTSVGLVGPAPIHVLGDETSTLRGRMIAGYELIVSGATDAPRDNVGGALAVILYATHLLVVLLWLQDSTPEQANTLRLVTFGEELLSRLRLLWRLRWSGEMIERLAGIIGGYFRNGTAAA